MSRMPIAEEVVNTVVLCIDDERCAHQLHAMLEDSGCEVRCAYDETGAVGVLTGLVADIVFIDSRLLSARTAQMVANIKRSRPRTRVVLRSDNGVVPAIGQEVVDVVVDSAELAENGWLLDELRNARIPFLAKWLNGWKHLPLSQKSS